MDGQMQLLKSAEKDHVEQEVIRNVRWVLRLAPASWTQVAGEEVCITTYLSKEHHLYLLQYCKDREGPLE